MSAGFIQKDITFTQIYPDRQLEDNQAYIYIQKTNKSEETCALKKGEKI